jgi:pimeloyl-ACP methyl ester carboxylesterase
VGGWRARRVLAAALAAAVVWALAAPAAAADGDATGAEAFYAAPRRLGDLDPGDVIRSEPIAAPAGAQAWRVLYRSESAAGRPIAVSGVIVAPDAPAPARRPVVTWAHGTTGIADQCAPSRFPMVATRIPYVDELLAAGNVVTATDYEGLGTEGVHPYLVGRSEGRGVLDAARAARNLRATGAGRQVTVIGHSQGGQAALFAGELAADYAPELDVAGVVAIAPVSDLGTIIGAAARIPRAAGFAVMAATGFAAAYPEIDLDRLLTAEARAKAGVVDTECAGAVIEAYAATEGTAYAIDPRVTAPYDEIVVANTAGRARTDAPVLLVHGTGDTLIPVVLSRLFLPSLCATGTVAELRTYEGATHGSVLTAAAPDVLAWVAARRSGEAAPSSCPAR